MESKKNNSEYKRIWMYAIVLFTGAFTVLLITAFSQIKLNKNITEYKTQLSSVEKKKVNFELNLNTALDENRTLLKKVEELNKKIAKDNKELNDYKKNVANTKDILLKSKHSYEVLIEAENKFKNNDIIGSAVLLQTQCDQQYLDAEGNSKYQILAGKTFYEAAQSLYYNGYKSYKNANYDSAISDLQSAVKLQPNEYFADDCYYFIAYSEYRKGNKNGVIQAAQTLILKYPDSTYVDDVNNLLKLQ